MASLEKLLHEPYDNQYKWWAPTELIRRLLVIIFITAFPRNLVCHIIAITVLISFVTDSGDATSDDRCSSVHVYSTIPKIVH